MADTHPALHLQESASGFHREAAALAAAISAAGVSSGAFAVDRNPAASDSLSLVKEALVRANTASAEALDKLLQRSKAAEASLPAILSS